ncbi:hypothetical protein WA026_014492 [Henosepilachna vigintioctopunctata]|uniref:Large ribosomal subunit protein P2 n=1 Tax=Henosepilachna vigintioctopunctata TaxID=420089 RepID=A0AAW1UBY6_9CUCU
MGSKEIFHIIQWLESGKLDDDIEVTRKRIQTIIEAANVKIEPYWLGLFAEALEGVNIKELVTRLGLVFLLLLQLLLLKLRRKRKKNAKNLIMTLVLYQLDFN